jgi:hypothetical protein
MDAASARICDCCASGKGHSSLPQTDVDPQMCFEGRWLTRLRRFAPLDYPTPTTSKTLTALFHMYSLPTAFLAERVQSVTHAFGSEGSKDGKFCKLRLGTGNLETDNVRQQPGCTFCARLLSRSMTISCGSEVA